MLADLHIHTHYSDSTHSPTEVVVLAKEKGIGLISICDHNIISAYDELIPICKAEGLSLIVGSEISTLYQGNEYHILGLGFDLGNKNMISLLDYSQNIYAERGNRLIESMTNDYSNISVNEFQRYNRNRKNGGWESIDYLRSKGIVDSLPEFYIICSKYGSADINKFRSISEVCDTIHKAGGKAILAHAGDSVDNKLEIFKPKLSELLEQGIDGFECYYTSHSQVVTQTLADFCTSNDLLITAGSDDHGGFNNIIDGHEYYIGAVNILTDKLSLNGIQIL